MTDIKRVVLENRGERVELLSRIPESATDLQEIKDLIRSEYQRRGYIPQDIVSFEDEYDETSVYFGTYANGDLLAAARIIDSEELPTGSVYYRFPLPEPLEACPKDQLKEVSRLTAIVKPRRNPLPNHVVSSTMISSLIDFGFKENHCGGISTIKVWFLRLFQRLDLPALHEITDAELIYPRDAVLSGFFYDEDDPAVPIYYLHDEAKAIFDGIFHNIFRVDKTLLDEPLRLISHEVLI